MAKGNDGNYLQHSVEVALATHLAARHPDGCLHVASAHGMAPFEACGELPNGQARLLLHGVLRAAQQAPASADPPILAAYRATNASLDHYPNTAELLRRVVGQDRLSGGITEVDAQKCEQLKHAWASSGVKPVNSSWRSQTSHRGVLTAPGALDFPWLFTMDPMTYREGGYADDNYLYRADLARVSGAVGSFVASGKPGVGALFVYAVRPEVQPQFWAFVDDLAAHTKTTVTSCWLTHQGGNRNLAALLCSAFVLPPNWLPNGLVAGR